MHRRANVDTFQQIWLGRAFWDLHTRQVCSEKKWRHKNQTNLFIGFLIVNARLQFRDLKIRKMTVQKEALRLVLTRYSPELVILARL